jgi:hypothetical protein
MEAFLTFIGRLHPLIVHLPIGFILLALLIEFYKKYFKESEKFLKFILFWTIISGFFFADFGLFTIPARRLSMGNCPRAFLFWNIHPATVNRVLFFSSKAGIFNSNSETFLLFGFTGISFVNRTFRRVCHTW